MYRPPIVVCDNVSKEFRTPKRQPGMLGGLRTLFTREYATKRAVDGVSFSVEEGELIGYIGPNGAGKSTTIKMLTGILTPTTGELRVAGLEPQKDRTTLARRLGVVFGQRSTLWWDLPLRDSFDLLQKIYRVDPARFASNLTRYVELLDLQDLLD